MRLSRWSRRACPTAEGAPPPDSLGACICHNKVEPPAVCADVCGLLRPAFSQRARLTKPIFRLVPSSRVADETHRGVNPCLSLRFPERSPCALQKGLGIGIAVWVRNRRADAMRARSTPTESGSALCRVGRVLRARSGARWSVSRLQRCGRFYPDRSQTFFH